MSRISWIALVLLAVGTILLNGLLAMLEDDLPGGFNNPDGASTPPYVRRFQRIARLAGPLAAAFIAAAGFTAAPDWSTVVLWVGLGITLLVFSLPKSWPLVFRWRSWLAVIPLVLTMAGTFVLSRPSTTRAHDVLVAAVIVALCGAAGWFKGGFRVRSWNKRMERESPGIIDVMKKLETHGETDPRAEDAVFEWLERGRYGSAEDLAQLRLHARTNEGARKQLQQLLTNRIADLDTDIGNAGRSDATPGQVETMRAKQQQLRVELASLLRLARND